ncbi:MAG: OB-fold nucleic acid binding domain-containing protein, partial [Candidatus Vogelbacteria bacterium]|nr:OB-fold nucleic acid binding domain-containing protein [Candidatus Vogelbacteria bacterium]
MASLEEIRAERLKKLALLKERGMEAYPAATARDHSVAETLANFADLEATKTAVCLAGRVMSIRGQGAILFFNLNDGTGSFQGLLKKDDIPADDFSLFTDTVDIGDFIEIDGT